MEIITTINALQNQDMWNELLRIHHQADNDVMKTAVRQLTAYIEGMREDEVSSDSLSRLLDQIDFLRKEIDTALRHAEAPLSPGVVHEYMRAASNVASEVMLGIMAVSTTAEVAGGRLVPEVIYTAVGLAVAASVRQIYKKSASKFRAHTILAQLQKYHDELIESIDQLYSFLGWLAGPAPPTDDALEIVQSVYVAAGFLVSHVEQLATAFPWPERSDYWALLRGIRALLDRIGNIIAGGDNGDIKQARTDLRDVSQRLQGFSGCIMKLNFN